jgi:hypothetical protein
MVYRMAVYKHVVGGPGAAGDIWTSGFHSWAAVDDLAAAHAALIEWGDTALAAGGLAEYWADTTSVTNLTTYRLNPATGRATGVVRSSAAIVGLGGAQQPAPRDCVVVGLRTDLPGASGRGRMYLPAVSTDNLTSTGLISNAAKTAIADIFAMAMVNHLSWGYTPGIWRLALGNTITDLVGVTVSAVQGNQRRRSNKIPANYAIATV